MDRGGEPFAEDIAKRPEERIADGVEVARLHSVVHMSLAQRRERGKQRIQVVERRDDDREGLREPLLLRRHVDAPKHPRDARVDREQMSVEVRGENARIRGGALPRGSDEVDLFRSHWTGDVVRRG